MFNFTTPIRLRQGFDGHALRRIGRTVILSLTLLFCANIFCMEEGNKPNPAIPVDEQGNIIIAENNGILGWPKKILRDIIQICAKVNLPKPSFDAQNNGKLIVFSDELLLKVIQALFEGSENEIELGAAIKNICLLNNYFNDFMHEPVLIKTGLNQLDQLKTKFYDSRNLKYSVKGKFDMSDLVKSRLITRIKKFIKNKDQNVLDSNKSDKDSVLCNAIMHDGNIDLMITALNNITNVDEKTVMLQTCLKWASWYAYTAAIKVLLENGAKVDRKCMYGKTALIHAARLGNKKTIDLLLENGAKIDETDNQGWTSLMVAAESGNPEGVEALLERGANINIKSNEGWTALDFANRRGGNAVIKLLKEHAKKLHAENSMQNAPQDSNATGQGSCLIS